MYTANSEERLSGWDPWATHQSERAENGGFSCCCLLLVCYQQDIVPINTGKQATKATNP